MFDVKHNFILYKITFLQKHYREEIIWKVLAEE